MTWNSIKSILKIFKNESFLLQSCKKKHKKGKVEKTKTGKELLFLMPKNIGDRVLSVFKTKISTEYTEKGIRYFEN